MDIQLLNAEFEALQPSLEHRDERMGRRCCLLALEAARLGSYGVGAVLSDAQGDIIAEGYNRVFESGYRAAAHAEMECLNTFEQRYPNYGDRSGLTLTVLLEPCPMCLSRILLTGIGRVSFLCTDHDGGMAHSVRHMPAAWRELASLADIQEADVSLSLREFAAKLSKSSLSEHRKRLISQIRG